MTSLGNLAGRAHEVGLAEEGAGAYTQFTADNLLIEAVVTVDHHIVDTCLRAFNHSHFERYRVS